MKLKEVQDEVKRFTRIQIILISLIAVLTLFGTIIVVSGENAISRFGYDTFTMVKYSIIDHPVETVKNWMSDLAALRSVQEENDELRQMIASQKMYKAELDEAKRAVAEMEELMDFSANINYDKINASLIGRDMSTWSSIVTINKGSKDGVEKDMAVISSKGLIGKISEVHSHSSKVKLLTTESDEINVSVKVEIDKDKTTAGILMNYNASTKTYQIQLFDSNAEVKKKMKVITSGNGGVFPSGILIGEVKEVKESYDTKGKMISVTPSVDFNDFSYVSIVKVK